jgi:hypothetical protein
LVVVRVSADETVSVVAYRDLERQLRAVYDALLEARTYVAHAHYEHSGNYGPDARREATALLERVDGALADAGEWL